jgi:Uma2 family endonuclease
MPMGNPPELQEIVVPDTEPETEWILGEAVQKVSPRRTHGVLQFAMASRLHAWAAGRGTVATEWRLRISPPGERPRPLVPDVAYLSNERKAGLHGELLEVPFVAPDIIVEILSPDDRADRIASKRDTYLAAGVRLVLIVDPVARVIDAWETTGCTTFGNGATFTTEAFPGLTIDVEALFAEID